MAVDPKPEKSRQLVRNAVAHRWESVLAAAARANRRVDAKKNQVALTFDDGPDPRYTPQLLESLEKAGVLGTFFWVGARALEQPELCRLIRRAGHSVGSHSYAHFSPAGRSTEQLRSDYRSGREAVEEVIGEGAPLFRPPYGSLTLKSVRVLRQLKLVPWLWSSDSGDWREGSTTDRLLRTLTDVVPGDVVLLHDGVADGPGASAAADRSATIDIVEPLAKSLHRRGLTFVTLDGHRAR